MIACRIRAWQTRLNRRQLSKSEIRGCTQVIASTTMSEPLFVAYMNRGIAYAEQHKPAKALADLGAAIDASKTNAAAYYNRGNVL